VPKIGPIVIATWRRKKRRAKALIFVEPLAARLKSGPDTKPQSLGYGKIEGAHSGKYALRDPSELGTEPAGSHADTKDPVKAGLVDSAEDWPYCYSYLAKKKAQGLKPSSSVTLYGPTKVVP